MKKVLAVAMIQVLMLVGTVGLVAPTVGCNSQTVVADIEKFIPVIGDILQILVASGVLSAAQAQNINSKAQADGTLAGQLYNDYEAALKANSPQASVIFANMNAAFTAFENDSATVFQLCQVKDPNVQEKINVVVASAQAILALIETMVPGGSLAFAAHKPAGVSEQPTRAQWKAAANTYNDAIKIKTGNAAVDAIPYHLLK